MIDFLGFGVIGIAVLILLLQGFLKVNKEKYVNFFLFYFC